MRYYYEKRDNYTKIYGKTYECNHFVYDRCTLYKIKDKGLAIIQQRYNPENKNTYWTEIDNELIDVIYLNVGFKDFFDKYAKKSQNGIYPTVTIRQIMYNLKMKPLKKNIWETCFDKKPI